MMQHSKKITSRFMVEANTFFPLDEADKRSSTTVETFVFLPRSLGVNKKSTPAHLFYRELENQSRLALRRVTVNHLASADCEATRLLRDAVDMLGQRRDQATISQVRLRHRIYCKWVGDTVADYVERALDSNNGPELVRFAENYQDCARVILERFRATFSPETAVVGAYSTTYDESDEYLSMLFEQRALELLDRLKKVPTVDDGAAAQKLLALAQAESKHRKESGYSSIGSAHGHNEALVYRQSELQSVVDQSVALSSRYKPEGTVTRELMLSLAAGVAMIFATAVAFMAHVKYENWTTTFFIILVISYMGKDRLKAAAQSYLASRSKRMFYDYKADIYGAWLNKPVGLKREQLLYVNPAAIDPQVLAARYKGLPGGAEMAELDENVLCYKRQTRLYNSRFADDYSGFAVEGVSNILRSDYAQFARHMEDTKRTIYVPTDNAYVKAKGRRLYHIHVVKKVSADDGTHYEHFQVVMNRGGIRHLKYD